MGIKVRFSVVGMFVTILTVPALAQGNFGPAPSASPKSTYMVSATTADPGLKTSENDDNVVLVPKGTPRPELFVWYPGSNGHPQGDSAIMNTAVNGGYRVIGLQYNNRGTVENQCRAGNDPECLTKERTERFQGGVADAPIPNSVEEGIVHRLTMLLKYLAAKHPQDGWGMYLKGDAPAWDKMVIAGHSQGAAMAAYTAKHYEVARVVIFSGGADGAGDSLNTRKWSSWLTMPSATPPDRWYAEYNAREQIALAQPTDYEQLLKIPHDHILKFSLDLPTSAKQGPGLVAHMSVVHDPRYLSAWQWMIGTSDKKPAM